MRRRVDGTEIRSFDELVANQGNRAFFSFENVA